ncbi:MAG: COR domain-containing protein [Cyanobacteria bacterium J06621_11]
MSKKKRQTEKWNLASVLEKARKEEATELDLSERGLTELPAELFQIKSLKVLNLSGNQLTTLPNEIGQLNNLSELNLSGNQLTTLPQEISQLNNLLGLYLHGNQLTMLPQEISQLNNLSKLNLFDNQLTTLPQEIGQLTNLSDLVLSGNRLTTLPQEIGQLTNLSELYLFDSQLTTLPQEIGQLNNLLGLYLSSNQLTTLPQEIGQLNNLSELYLDDNQLTALPQEIGQLNNLSELYLHKNERLSLSSEILGPDQSETMFGRATPANPKDILDYYFRIQVAQHPLNEAKLIFVGFGAVGKTSLVNRLSHGTFDPKSKKTEGIQITPWKISLQNATTQSTENITLNVWDFGGQEIMHSTHQFFLTERSLYVLVLNGRQGHEDSDAEYWLELIQSFGADSPVIVVLNKMKEHPFDVNRRALQEKYNNIKAFIQTDCETEQGIEQLKEMIKQQTDQLEDLRAPFPGSWVAIKDELANMPDNYISFKEYREICQRDGEEDTQAQDYLAAHLHNLGIALNYKDDPRLRDTHVLNPRWVTSGIYTLLNDPDLTAAKGELTNNCLTRVLDTTQYPPERHGFLLDLMRKFELCLRFAEDENRYLIPDLLDKQQPEAASAFILTDCLNFRYTYPILPEGLIPRFIVRTHVLSEQPSRWRTGVILTFEDNCALVKSDPQNRHVTISVNGSVTSRRRLLAIIRSDFDRIHNSFKFIPEELVPVPKHPTVTVRYKDLLLREEKGRTEFEEVVDGELVVLKVQELLNGVDIEGSRKHFSAIERRSDTLRLFYSYSHRDEHLRDQLDTHLKILERQGLIQGWHDRRIVGGEDWKTELDNNLQQADIILLLISADFIASDYCYETEMTTAIERHQQGKATVIPIALRPTDWGNAPFKGLQGFPSDLKPVTQWRDRDAAWYNVEQGIKKAIEDRRSRRGSL